MTENVNNIVQLITRRPTRVNVDEKKSIVRSNDITTCSTTTTCTGDACHTDCRLNTDNKKCKPTGPLVNDKEEYTGTCVECMFDNECPGAKCGTTNTCTSLDDPLPLSVPLFRTTANTAIAQPMDRTQSILNALTTDGKSVSDIFLNTR